MYLVLRGNPLGAAASRFHFSSHLLSYLDLSDCALERFPAGLPASVRYLQLRRNRLRTPQPTADAATGRCGRRNRLRTLARRDLVDVGAELNILVLDENRLERIDDDTFRATTNLQQLWLNGNRLRALPRALPAALERLFVDSNRLESLTAADFTPPPGSAPTRQLATLSAMSNNISRVAGDALAGLPRLASLDLAANRIRTLDAGTFAANGHLRALALSKNPLESFGARCMAGLRRLETLALAYVPTPDVRLADDAFGGHLPALRRLDASHSPGLVAALMRSDRALGALGAVRDLGRPARSVQGPRSPSAPSETSVCSAASWRRSPPTSRTSFATWPSCACRAAGGAATAPSAGSATGCCRRPSIWNRRATGWSAPVRRRCAAAPSSH